MTQHHRPDSTRIAATIARETGLNAARCYQCGKCSAGCPMAEEMELRPHDIVRLIQRNEVDRLFANPSPWLCLTCETCTARCPNEVDPARLIDAVRELILRQEGAKPPRSIMAFHRSFLKQIHGNGRVFEFGLIAGYKTRTGKLFNDVGAVPGMVQRGKLALTPRRIRGIDDVRRIMVACMMTPEAGRKEGEE